MGRKEYLESMGVRAARRAFFSYTTEPEGSYSIHRVFIRFLEVNRMDMGQAEKPKAAAFLTDYILLRIYVAKYVLAGYAETYAPLLDLFRGFEKVEKKFSLFMERETAPGHGAERKFLPPDLRRRYDERGMRKTIELFDSISRRYEEREDTPERVMKCIVDECLSTIAIRNEISLSAPSFWFFTREMNGYIRYLNRFYSILDRMIQDMTNARLGNSISVNFMTQMIPHHRAAIEMSQNLLQYTTNIPLQNIALQIVKR